MAEPEETETPQVNTEVAAKVEAAEPKREPVRKVKTKAAPKQQPARRAKAKAVPVLAKEPAVVVQGKRKVYSEKERTEKLKQIEKALAQPGATMKAVIAEAKISEQTYYHWKKKASAPAVADDDPEGLRALEEENKRLQRQWAEHLRKVNADLKKKLGLG